MKISNKSFEMAEQSKYLGEPLTNQKFRFGRNSEHVEVMECLLSFAADSFVLQFAIQKYKY